MGTGQSSCNVMRLECAGMIQCTLHELNLVAVLKQTARIEEDFSKML